jgi:hypothetical protein
MEEVATGRRPEAMNAHVVLVVLSIALAVFALVRDRASSGTVLILAALYCLVLARAW